MGEPKHEPCPVCAELTQQLAATEQLLACATVSVETLSARVTELETSIDAHNQKMASLPKLSEIPRTEEEGLRHLAATLRLRSSSR